ncbi:MAG TPA: RNA polymerase sigma factor [Ignavibacteriaceae bacterium]|nr:RNA polymerase sigma factor [Ignavibacteriaceae bacterium]
MFWFKTENLNLINRLDVKLSTNNIFMVIERKDSELIENFLKGDQSSFKEIVERYKDKIYWHARRMTGNHLDADEIVQEVLIVIFKKLKDFRFQSSLYTWIYKITSTRSLNLIKKRNIKRFFSIDDDEHKEIKYGEDIVSNIENKEKLVQLDGVLKKLPVKQREIFILRHFEQLSYEEISKITGKSLGGLKANYFHALNKVLDEMSE